MHVDIQTPQGALRGLQRADHQAFLGVPYAAPPTGALRFAAMGALIDFDVVAMPELSRFGLNGCACNISHCGVRAH